MERLTERKRNFNGTAISKKSMIDREGYAFSKWLIKTGWTIEEPKGIWEVLRAKKAGRQNPLIVYQKMNKEHLSVLDRDIDVIKRFLQEK